MIDIDTEDLIPFQQAPDFIPGAPCLQTLHRWRLKGVRGARLETILCGGIRYTSREAIRRFIIAQNADAVTTQQTMTPARRRRQAEAAMAALRSR